MITKITNIDECEVEYKKLLGMEQEVKGYWPASKDSILVYADALGDGNPLWTNEEYAKKSRFGVLTAPPSFFFKVNDADWGAVGGACPLPRENISQMYSGAEFEFFRPIYVGDEFTVKQKALNLVRKESKSRGAILFGTGQNTYYNQRKEVVGILRATVAMVPITRKSTDAPPIRVHDPAKPGVVAKNPDVLAFDRKRRGDVPRYWEDIKEGQEMEPLERGVLTATEITRWQLNVVGRESRVLVRKKDELVVGLARAATSQLAHGVQDPEDFGPQRMAWLNHYMTEWMGDDGTLKKITGQVRSPNMMGDINVVKGKVTKKYIENGEHLVDCEIGIVNQGDNITAPGWATVALPSKG
jgi:acyl dehydratase